MPFCPWAFPSRFDARLMLPKRRPVVKHQWNLMCVSAPRRGQAPRRNGKGRQDFRAATKMPGEPQILVPLGEALVAVPFENVAQPAARRYGEGSQHARLAKDGRARWCRRLVQGAEIFPNLSPFRAAEVRIFAKKTGRPARNRRK